jgi:hypothetical protein
MEGTIVVSEPGRKLIQRWNVKRGVLKRISLLAIFIDLTLPFWILGSCWSSVPGFIWQPIWYILFGGALVCLICLIFGGISQNPKVIKTLCGIGLTIFAALFAWLCWFSYTIDVGTLPIDRLCSLDKVEAVSIYSNKIRLRWQDLTADEAEQILAKCEGLALEMSDRRRFSMVDVGEGAVGSTVTFGLVGANGEKSVFYIAAPYVGLTWGDYYVFYRANDEQVLNDLVAQLEILTEKYAKEGA